MVLATVLVCRVSLDTVERRVVSKREEEKPSIFKEEKSIKGFFSRAVAVQEPSLHKASLAFVPLLGHH